MNQDELKQYVFDNVNKLDHFKSRLILPKKDDVGNIANITISNEYITVEYKDEDWTISRHFADFTIDELDLFKKWFLNQSPISM